ncbi:hypothetical protein E2C01_042620 [Portunus trituberculatus]|uniref:Uncharacterized protein n=1 Tax=Portunus trituberculatus TaxID=210409 RepID=A0A5B7FU27_PORTR|nr:hypothetical protein [Portunus trituberculatus]
MGGYGAWEDTCGHGGIMSSLPVFLSDYLSLNLETNDETFEKTDVKVISYQDNIDLTSLELAWRRS